MNFLQNETQCKNFKLNNKQTHRPYLIFYLRRHYLKIIAAHSLHSLKQQLLHFLFQLTANNFQRNIKIIKKK